MKRNYKLVLALIVASVLVSTVFSSWPSYTKLCFVFLIFPTLFIFFRKGGHLDYRKLLVGCLIAVGAGILWDNIAIYYHLWDFPKQSVIAWLIGIPVEEYFFGFWLVSVTLGIYTSLRSKHTRVLNVPHFKIIPVLFVTTFLQLLVLYSLIFGNPHSYIKWLLVLAIIPSFFYIFRKGEKIDYSKMILTALIMAGITFLYDYIFILGGAWVHYDSALIGRIGIVPIDDVLFTFFSAITIIGFYTSIPHNHPFMGKWKE